MAFGLYTVTRETDIKLYLLLSLILALRLGDVRMPLKHD